MVIDGLLNYVGSSTYLHFSSPICYIIALLGEEGGFGSYTWLAPLYLELMHLFNAEMKRLFVTCCFN